MAIFDIMFTVASVLAWLSMAVIVVLIILCVLRLRDEEREDTRAQELVEMALEAMELPGLIPDFIQSLNSSDQEFLLSMLDGLLPKIRGQQALCVVEMMESLGVVERSLRDLRSFSEMRRAKACSALAYFKRPAVLVALQKALDDPCTYVRIVAARSLVCLQAEIPVVLLFDKLVTDDSYPAQMIFSVFRSLDDHAAPDLIQILQGHHRVAAKLLAADALGRMGCLESVPALTALASHPSATVRSAVLNAFAKLGDPRAIPSVLDLCLDLIPEVRIAATNCAKKLSAPEFIPTLKKLLADQHWTVRFHAAEALLELETPGLESLQEVAQQQGTLAADIASGILRERGFAF